MDDREKALVEAISKESRVFARWIEEQLNQGQILAQVKARVVSAIESLDQMVNPKQ